MGIKEKAIKGMFVSSLKTCKLQRKRGYLGFRVKKPSLLSSMVKNILNHAIIFPTF